MLSRIGVGVAASFLFLAPDEMLVELFVRAPLEVDLVRLVASVAIVWAIFEVLAVWRHIPISAQWSVVGMIGVGFLVSGLAAKAPTLVFFAFPLIVGSALSTSLGLAESWRTELLARESSEDV